MSTNITAGNHIGLTMRIAHIVSFLLVATTVTGCFSLGYRYRHLGKKHMMTKENAAYHKKVVDDVNQQFGVLVGATMEKPDPQSTDATLNELKSRLTDQIGRYEEACKAIRAAVSGSPDGNSFTSAGRLLELDAELVCGEASNGRSSLDTISRIFAQRSEANQKGQDARATAIQEFYSRQLNRGANGTESAEAAKVVCQGAWAKEYPQFALLETAELGRCVELRQGLQK